MGKVIILNPCPKKRAEIRSQLMGMSFGGAIIAEFSSKDELAGLGDDVISKFSVILTDLI